MPEPTIPAVGRYGLRSQWELSRRSFLRLLAGTGLAGLAACASPAGTSAPRPTETTAAAPSPPTTSSTTQAAPAPPSFELADFADNIQRGGPPKDGIPPIDEPQFVPASQFDFLEDQDVVFGLARQGEAKAYPQLVLVWHEIVNDLFPDGPLSITYCPLTGSVVAVRGAVPSGDPYTFGTSGNLVNSNLLMYDRQTDSRWPQILARGITEPALGETLEEIPVAWTTWARWREAHPDTLVLTTDTGYARSYGSDPYGSYNPLGGYYAPRSGRFFPVMHVDERFEDKEVFIGIKHGEGRLAARKETLRTKGVLQTALGGDPVTVLYDPALDEGWAYRAETAGKTLRLSAEEPGRYRDEESGSSWDATGQALSGPLEGARLDQLVSYDVMWFAWVSFFPSTEVAA